ncbi:hypothetical protein [Cryobacterium sp. TMT1-66-1]|uniref:hypothetical protein n=1 Tax=Cryobacterium sp. TMT1-66-1 TaxID=1259242 RepID=UPI00106C138B|nr:hypothetical protein [Cryobacterium sp. TMT1-66-1]TFD04138.1 hypothetical protein E3T29_15910 [Cryobacterium sp. TMT1-66-1]
MKNLEIVWRTLADAAVTDDKRRWSGIRELAEDSGVPLSTTHQSLRRLYTIGALRPNHGQGFSVINPEKILTLLAAARDLGDDRIGSTTWAGAEDLAAKVRVVVGGTDAAVAILGCNTVADLGQRIVYTADPIDALPVGDEVLVLRQDATAAATGSRHTSVAQTYADLFAQPRWQAAEFLEALRHQLFPTV